METQQRKSEVEKGGGGTSRADTEAAGERQGWCVSGGECGTKSEDRDASRE